LARRLSSMLSMYSASMRRYCISFRRFKHSRSSFL
jgi:hypothetical protein